MKIFQKFFKNDEKLSANEIAFVKNNKAKVLDEILSNLEEKHIYSTQETIIGKWVDNQLIYRKVIDLGSYQIKNGIHQINIPNTPVDTLINTNFCFKYTDTWYSSIFGSIYTLKWSNNTTLEINATENVNTQAMYIILEYTKK